MIHEYIVENGIVRLPDRKYSLNLSNISRNGIPTEMKIFKEITKILNIDLNETSERQRFLCIEAIYNLMKDK